MVPQYLRLHRPTVPTPPSHLRRHHLQNHHLVTSSFPRQGSSRPSRGHPVSLRLPAPRSSISLSSASSAAGSYPRQARTTLLPAALSPSCSGLRTAAATPFTSQGSTRTWAARLPLRRVQALRPVSASSEPFFGLPPRATCCYLLLLASQTAKCRECLTGPLLLRWGVQPPLLPRAFFYLDALLFFVVVVCGVLDLLDILREHLESKEHYRKIMEKYDVILSAMSQRQEEGGEKELAAKAEIQG